MEGRFLNITNKSTLPGKLWLQVLGVFFLRTESGRVVFCLEKAPNGPGDTSSIDSLFQSV